MVLESVSHVPVGIARGEVQVIDFVWKTKKAIQIGLNSISARVGGTTATHYQ